MYTIAKLQMRSCECEVNLLLLPRGAAGRPLRMLRHTEWRDFKDLDIREAGYNVCPIADCSSRAVMMDGHKVFTGKIKNIILPEK